MSTNASFGISVRGFRWRAPVLKHEWILNCMIPKRLLGKENWRYIDQILPRLLPWYLGFILNSEIRTKNAETVPFLCNIQTVSLIRNSLFNSFASQIDKRRAPKYQQITRLNERFPLVEKFPSSGRVYLSNQF